MNYRIRSSKNLSPKELIKVIEELDLDKLGLMELKTLEPKEGEQQPSQFYLEAIRRKLYNFYVVKREVPTLKALLRALKKEIKFKGSTRSLRKMLRKDGLQFTHRAKKPKKHHSKKSKHCRCHSKKHRKNDEKDKKNDEQQQ